MDAKDILGLPETETFNLSHGKKSRPHKGSQCKPDGISRELSTVSFVFLVDNVLSKPNYLGGSPKKTKKSIQSGICTYEWSGVLMPSINMSQLKRRPPSDEKITWQWLPFTNSARKDTLQIYHWVRIVNGVPPIGNYSFAKYNKSADIVKYTDEEYEKYLIDPMWSREETDQLFELCERFDLRFVAIADRFPSPQTVEELKNRYYSVARAILLARAPSPGDVSDHPLVKETYNVSQEIQQKCALSMIFSQTKCQERKESEILAEAKKIAQARMVAWGAEESELPPTTHINPEGNEKSPFPADTVSPSNLQISSAAPSMSMVDNAATLASLRMLRVYLRSYALDQMVQAVNSNAGLRTVKRVEQTLQDLGVNLKPRVPTKAVCAGHLELRKEILTLLNLQKQLQYKEAEGSSYRDTYVDTPDTPKRSGRAGETDQTFIPESISFGGERIAKKDLKRKAPGRPAEAPSSPAQSKRPRKFKTSDM